MYPEFIAQASLTGTELGVSVRVVCWFSIGLGDWVECLEMGSVDDEA